MQWSFWFIVISLNLIILLGSACDYLSVSKDLANRWTNMVLPLQYSFSTFQEKPPLDKNYPSFFKIKFLKLKL